MLQLPPNDDIEQGEYEERSKGGHCDPGPCAVEDDVVPAQPELCWPYISDLMVATTTASEVHAVTDCLGFKKLSNIEESCNQNTGKDIHHCSGHLRGGEPEVNQ